MRERRKRPASQRSAVVTELLLIRHAPVVPDGRLAGRRDVSADCSDAQALSELRAKIGPCDHVVSSPAVRCLQTAAALWPSQTPEIDERLWEQNFGAWEGLTFAEVPDRGPMSKYMLIAMQPPDGESFDDLCDRSCPALATLARRGGRVAVVAHAGTVRAALTMALGLVAPALAFQIQPLSVTQFTVRNGRLWSIGGVNWVPPTVRALPIGRP